MALVPLSYNLRSLWVRKSATLLTILGIGATVAVLAGVLALRAGFQGLFRENGREDIAVFLRQGSTNEGDSAFTRERAEILMKTLDAFQTDAQGKPLVSAETYLAVRLFKTDGGETNVPVRGVQPMTFAIYGAELQIVEGRNFTPGTDEVVVGDKIADRIQDCHVGDTVQFNTTPFKVVGVFHHAVDAMQPAVGVDQREFVVRPAIACGIEQVRQGGLPDQRTRGCFEARQFRGEPQPGGQRRQVARGARRCVGFQAGVEQFAAPRGRRVGRRGAALAD